MSSLVKGVRGGTTANEPSLCESCRFCQVIQGKAVSQRFQLCSATYKQQRINFDVTECTLYEDKAKQDIYELKRVAWYLVPTEPYGELHFVPQSVFIKLKQKDEGVPPTTEEAQE